MYGRAATAPRRPRSLGDRSASRRDRSRARGATARARTGEKEARPRELLEKRAYQARVPLIPPPIRRSFHSMHAAGRRVLADAPILFIGIVIGVALLFRVAVGAAREATAPPVEVPTFATTTSLTPGPSNGSAADDAMAAAAATAAATATTAATASTTASTTSAETTGTPRRGIPMRRDPDARDLAPAPPRVGPRPRGHGRRVPHGG